METNNALGEYLRARRELVQPADVGLEVSGAGHRRVPGLRREEVAMLAGISSDYYLRLEQGRDSHPSTQVLDAIARVLQLNPEASAYLFELANPKPPRARRRRAERVPEGILVMLDAIDMPAFVEGKYTDVLAVNRMATALIPTIVPGGNRLRSTFLDPVEQEFFEDWEKGTEGVVAALRARAAGQLDDPRLVSLIGELSLRSDRFRRLWARHDIRRIEGSMTAVNHPQVGRMELYREKLVLAAADGLVMVVYHAHPGTESERLLQLLASATLPAARAGAPSRVVP
ncbi:helix-turn-helix transcriptional regulator [Leifsonia poae]|uniref:Transcriptional regulator n=1 Tax=Leifsonia poae TaxID=110933 RepID=A0A9W6M0I8_9MICO|nr:helix-turn-helix transcriptional regulator [Leifsonia poae]GLJ76965.1 transcriptional regulator [Leifsonia poae]